MIPLGAQFLDDARAQGYRTLPEVPLTAGRGVYFVMAPVAGHTKLFHHEEILRSADAAVVQRTVTCDRIEAAGTAPLANPCEVAAGYFRFGDRDVETAVGTAVRTLGGLLGHDPSGCFARVSGRLPIRESLLALGFADERVLVEPDAKRLTLGEGCPTGEYMFLYAPHRHGVVPVASIGIIPHGGRFATDSALFLERLTMIREQARYPSDSTLLRHLAAAVPVANLPVEARHRWIYLTRAVILCLRDGIEPANSYAGHHVKKMLRLLAYDVRAWPALDLAELATRAGAAAIEDCETLGYRVEPEDRADLARRFSQLLQTITTRVQAALRSVTREVSSGRSPLNEDEAARISGQHGVPRAWLLPLLAELGIDHPLDPISRRPILGFVGYPYDDSEQVDTSALFRPAMTARVGAHG